LLSARATVRDFLQTEGLEDSVGYFGRQRITVADVVNEFESRTAATDQSNP